MKQERLSVVKNMAVLEKTGPEIIEVATIKKDREYFFWTQGIRLQTLADDIFERSRAKEEIINLDQILEARISERTKELETSRAFLHAIFDACPDPILVSNEQGLITMISQQAEVFFGYTADELLGQAVELLVPDRHQVAHRTHRARFDSGPTSVRKMGHKLMANVKRKDGSELTAEINLSRIETNQGVFFANTFRDVSDLKAVVLEFQESRNLLQSIIDHTPARIFWKDKNLRYLGCNPAFIKDAGKTCLDEILGKDDYQMAWAEQADLYRADDLSVMVSGIPKLDFEQQQTTIDGRKIWLRTSKVPLLNKDQEVIGVLGISEDITEHKLAADSLQESNKRLNEAQQIAQIGSWTVDLTSGQYSRSDEVYRMFEIDPESFKATYESFLNVVHPDDRDSVGHAYIESLAKRMPLENTHRLQMRDGRIKWVQERCKVDYDASGNALRFNGTIQDITQLRAAEERIHELAFFDQLTGLPNRALLLDRLRQSVVVRSRKGNHGALLFIDLDHFKKLNDTLGHAFGDQLLKQVSQRLTNCVREGDTVARLGGDEFVVILAGLSSDNREAATVAEIVANKILSAISIPYLLDKVTHHTSASIGITLFGANPATIDELMKQADLAMYKSKGAGRNTWHFFDERMESEIKERVSNETDLLEAIEKRQFLLYYQAQVRDDGHITGAEVLVRWQHPQRGLVPPNEFIPLAEETGAIIPMGKWILETACTQLALWATQPRMAHLDISVNVSPRQFRQADFVDRVVAVLNATGANPQRLKIELTESLMVDNVEDIIEKMTSLKAVGVGFSMDDFGTGYSSLSYLKRMPLSQLKIDQSFVRDILTDQNDAVIAKAIVTLAQSLGLSVIAEGVETIMQRNLLAGWGCHAYQGYLYSRPVPIAGFETYVDKHCHSEGKQVVNNFVI